MNDVARGNSVICQCGRTEIALASGPILGAICYCESCRTAGRKFEQAAGAPAVVDAQGGVDYCLYRKDRVKIVQGADHLREHRLTPQSPTRRVVASCCNSPMFLDFTPAHWLTVFRSRLKREAPAPQMCTMAADLPKGVVLSKAIPAYDSQPPRFMVKLLLAWAAMGFRRPRIAW